MTWVLFIDIEASESSHFLGSHSFLNLEKDDEGSIYRIE